MHAPVDLVLRHLLDLQPERDVLVDGKVRIERVALEDHRDVAVAGRDVVDDAFADPDDAARDVLEPGDHPQRGRLAAARRADEHHELAVVDVELKLVDGPGPVGVDLADALETRLPPSSLLRANVAFWCESSRSAQRKRNAKRCAAAGAVLDPRFAALDRGELRDEREADAGSRRALGAVARTNGSKICCLCSSATTAVPSRRRAGAAGLGLGRNGDEDFVSGGVCLTRVRDEVVHDPLELRRIDLGDDRVGADATTRSPSSSFTAAIVRSTSAVTSVGSSVTCTEAVPEAVDV